MRSRFLLVGTIVTALVLFAWQSVSNAVLPWHEASMRVLPVGAPEVAAIRAALPENGVYAANQGLFVVASMRPDMGDRAAEMGGMLGRQLVLDLVAALVLALVVARLAAPAPARAALVLGGAGLAAGIIVHLSNWVWYGYTLRFSVVNLVDTTANLVIAGLVLGFLARRMGAEPAGVRAEGGIGTGAGVGARA